MNEADVDLLMRAAAIHYGPSNFVGILPFMAEFLEALLKEPANHTLTQPQVFWACADLSYQVFRGL